jgi:two-component system, NtrC family, response regulator HydG
MSKQLNVLVVDDNEDLLGTLALILKRRGFIVATATNGFSAVDMFLRGAFDVTLMDVILPGMNGVQAFRRIREINPEALVILMTACSGEDLISVALREGAYCVMNKPLHIDEMIEIIQQATLNPPILQVGDDPEIIETVKRKQGKAGYEVISGALGEEAARISSP